MRVCDNKLKRRIVCIRPKPIRGANMLSFSLAIGFGCVCASRGIQKNGLTEKTKKTDEKLTEKPN
jgi:hypothetical protein